MPSRGATKHNIADGQYPGKELYDVLLARCERAEVSVASLQTIVEKLVDQVPRGCMHIPTYLIEAAQEALREIASRQQGGTLMAGAPDLLELARVVALCCNDTSIARDAHDLYTKLAGHEPKP